MPLKIPSEYKIRKLYQLSFHRNKGPPVESLLRSFAAALAAVAVATEQGSHFWR